jgi:hypothetical protein
MAILLATCNKVEQRGEGVKPIDINRQMNVQYCDACLSLWLVYKWTGKFMNGISSVTDYPRPDQAHQVVTPEAIAAVEETVKENRHVAVNDLAAHLDMSHGSAHRIIHDFLQFHKYLIFNKLINI